MQESPGGRRRRGLGARRLTVDGGGGGSERRQSNGRADGVVNGITVWFGTANGFAAPTTNLPLISASEPSITPATVQFPDINGDGLADVVSLGSNGYVAFLGQGTGTSSE